MMMNKEEYVEKIVRDILNGEMKLENFVEEHFELVEKYEMLSNTYSMFCEDYLNPKSYKFEDLKELDYVYDKKEDEIVLIIGTFENHKTNEKIVRALVFGYKDFIEIPFKDNRFYPVQMANVRCE